MKDNLKNIPTKKLIEELNSREDVKLMQETTTEDTYAVCYRMGLNMKIPKGSVFVCITPAKQLG